MIEDPDVGGAFYAFMTYYAWDLMALALAIFWHCFFLIIMGTITADIIFHQAAIPRVSYSVEQPFHSSDTNISKTVRLFESARGKVNRVVWASSSSVYGGADILPTPESTFKNPKISLVARANS